MTRLTIGYSPCPNDTYIMAALAAGRVETPLAFEHILADVETLNGWAIQGRLEVTKLSFAAFGHVRGVYGLLRSGSALGRGCGPLVVAKPGRSLDELQNALIAGPGGLTTACLLLSLYLGKRPSFKHMVFSDIMPAVAAEKADFGLVIHEGRFTYQQYGLNALLDLGQWWEEHTGAPIPLGGIAIRRDLGPQIAAETDRAIRRSLTLANADPEGAMDYILAHAQEMDREVVMQHINLYVNPFSLELGDQGTAAVERLLSGAEAAGIIPPSDQPLMAYLA